MRRSFRAALCISLCDRKPRHRTMQDNSQARRPCAPLNRSSQVDQVPTRRSTGTLRARTISAKSAHAAVEKKCEEEHAGKRKQVHVQRLLPAVIHPCFAGTSRKIQSQGKVVLYREQRPAIGNACPACAATPSAGLGDQRSLQRATS